MFQRIGFRHALATAQLLFYLAVMIPYEYQLYEMRHPVAGNRNDVGWDPSEFGPPEWGPGMCDRQRARRDCIWRTRTIRSGPAILDCRGVHRRGSVPAVVSRGALARQERWTELARKQDAV